MGKCKCGSLAVIEDKRFRHQLCQGCFNTRRTEATKAGDGEWLEANIGPDHMTAEEKQVAGV